jgi:hypothetical protein
VLFLFGRGSFFADVKAVFLDGEDDFSEKHFSEYRLGCTFSGFGRITLESAEFGTIIRGSSAFCNVKQATIMVRFTIESV